MDVVARAKAFQESVRPRSREIEEARRFPADLARTMAEAGLFRMAVPRSLGGLEVEAATLLRAIELIGEADGSAGWCLMIGVTSTVIAAYLPREVAREVFAEPTTIVGGAFAPLGRAVREGDHYRLSGRWPWASGSINCQWLMGGSAILEDGKPRLLPNGMLDSRLLVFPTAQATLIDSWFAAGLCGTGSGDMEVRELRVPVTRSVSLMTDRPVEGGPLYVFPVFGKVSYGDTFGGLRSDVSGHFHHGDDIFGEIGQPLLAVADGTLFQVGFEKVGGYRLWLRDHAGNEFYYAHLSAYAAAAHAGAHVKAGAVIGFMGTTGDAFGSLPHLHFEVHPVSLLGLGYDGVTDPTPILESWKHLQDVRFAAAAGWAPVPPGGSGAPQAGAILLQASDISNASGLEPGALEKAARSLAVEGSAGLLGLQQHPPRGPVFETPTRAP